MSDTINDLTDSRGQIKELFRKRAPILVELRFPKMGTASDWYLLEDEEQFTELWRKLARGVEVHAASVWDVLAPIAVTLVR